MEDTRLLIGYFLWVLTVGLTLSLFAQFSKKYRKLGSLIFLVLIPTWVITAIIKGIEYIYFDKINDLFSAQGFIGLMIETLPILVLFGGLTFTIKYMKSRHQGIGRKNGK